MLLFAEINWPIYVFAFGCALAISILLRRSRKYFSNRAARQREQRPTQSDPPDHAAIQLHKPVSVQRWEIELEERTRECSAILDSKMIALQHLIRDADAATARLEGAISRMAAVERELSQQLAKPAIGPSSEDRPKVATPERTVPIPPSPDLRQNVPPDAFHGAYQGEPRW